MLDLSRFDFRLPSHLIARFPLKRRDQSRLLYVDRKKALIASQYHFRDILHWLKRGDILVLNNTRVVKARLRVVTAWGGKRELLLVSPLSDDYLRWRALAKPLKRLREGEVLSIGGRFLKVVEKSPPFCVVELGLLNKVEVLDFLDRWGEVPLPPYLRRKAQPEDRASYQTVYAKDGVSVAAPTAGLHFTPELLKAIRGKGVKLAWLNLEVGYGTFAPLPEEGVECLEQVRLHEERYFISSGLERWLECPRSKRGRIVAVGTTVVRALESWARGIYGKTDLFLYPGCRFHLVEALITNFHLPKSSLFLLVCAFGGEGLIRKAYERAIEEGFRFYSYGDAMFIE